MWGVLGSRGAPTGARGRAARQHEARVQVAEAQALKDKIVEKMRDAHRRGVTDSRMPSRWDTQWNPDGSISYVYETVAEMASSWAMHKYENFRWYSERSAAAACRLYTALERVRVCEFEHAHAAWRANAASPSMEPLMVFREPAAPRILLPIGVRVQICSKISNAMHDFHLPSFELRH